MRRGGSGAVAALALCALAFATPARATAPATLPLLGGSLTISGPSNANLGNATASVNGVTISGHLGTTTISDTRGSTAGWAVGISATDLSDGATPTPHTIAVGKMKVFIASADGPTVTAGVAVPSTTHATLATALTLATSAQALVSATSAGSNTVTYNPTVSVSVDSGVVAGTYSGTITQTVS